MRLPFRSDTIGGQMVLKNVIEKSLFTCKRIAMNGPQHHLTIQSVSNNQSIARAHSHGELNTPIYGIGEWLIIEFRINAIQSDEDQVTSTMAIAVILHWQTVLASMMMMLAILWQWAEEVEEKFIAMSSFVISKANATHVKCSLMSLAVGDACKRIFSLFFRSAFVYLLNE